MDLRELRYFSAVVEAGSLTAAAQRLHLSQPSLSLAIGRLESEVGVRLLERSSRGVEPTSAGRYLLDASVRVLSGVEEIVRTLKRFGEGVQGPLTIAAVPVLMWRWLPELLREHAAQAPGIVVKLLDPPPWQAIELLHDRSIDVAMIVVADASRFAERHREEFEVVEWGPVPLVAVLPSDAAHMGPVPLEFFDGRTLVLPHRTAAVPSLPEAVDGLLERSGVVPESVNTVETIQASLPLIESGLAVGILPDPGRESLERFSVRALPLVPDPEPLRAVVLVRRGDRLEGPAGLLVRSIRRQAVDRVRNSI